MTEMVRLEKVSVTFGNFRALTDVDFSVKAGERRAIIGPNGAGKSTLFNAIAGQRRPSRGRIWLAGRETTELSPDRIWSNGVARTFQRNQLFLGLTVWDNVELACAAHGQGRFGIRIDRLAMEAEIASILSRVRLGDRANVEVRHLAYGEQRQLELALALAGKPKILLLDEPTAGMSPAETESMVGLMAGLPREITLLIVEHDMDVVFSLADSITVLHLGEVLAFGTPDEIQRDEKVREVYMGGQGRR